MNESSATVSAFEFKRNKVEETLTDEEIDNLLEDYIQVDDPLTIDIDSHVRYFTIVFEHKKAKKIFRLGGKLFSVSPDGDYLILKHGSNIIQAHTNQSIFYKHLSISEIKDEYEEILDKYEDEILDLKRLNKKLYSELTGRDTQMKGGRHARLQKLQLSSIKPGESDDEKSNDESDNSLTEPRTIGIKKGIQSKLTTKTITITKVSNVSSKSKKSTMSCKKTSTIVPPSKLEMMLGKHIRL